MTSELHIKQAPQNLFDCPICLEILVMPITLTCGHTFCEPCIKSNFFNFVKRLCPLCRRYLPHNLNEFSVNLLLDHLLQLQFSQTKDYRKRLQTAKTFAKIMNNNRLTVIYRGISNILPWMIVVLLLYHLLKIKTQASSLDFKGCKERVLKMVSSIKIDNNIEFKFFLFSQFLRFLFSTIALA